MYEEFNSECIIVLDKSAMERSNKYATIFMCIGNKPHPLINERDTIFSFLMSVLWISQTLEDKYFPQQLGKKEYN